MTSAVEICNMAVANIGEAGDIEELTELTEAARLCNLFYDRARRATLRAHAWNFATEYRVLSQVLDASAGDTIPDNWSYAYTYPTQFLRILNIVNQANRDDTDSIEFKVIHHPAHGKIIVTDEDDAEIRGILNITDPAQFDDMYIDALAWRIAYHVARPLTGSRSKRDEAARAYVSAIRDAESIDAAEGHQDEFEEADWIKARK